MFGLLLQLNQRLQRRESGKDGRSRAGRGFQSVTRGDARRGAPESGTAGEPGCRGGRSANSLSSPAGASAGATVSPSRCPARTPHNRSSASLTLKVGSSHPRRHRSRSRHLMTAVSGRTPGPTVCARLKMHSVLRPRQDQRMIGQLKRVVGPTLYLAHIDHQDSHMCL
jgi:hypothetical protein